MISHLSIQNYALIEALQMDPARGLNMVTGETGAGKSIMLGAIGLLLGNRADTKALLDSDKKCIIEATFDISKLKLKQVFEELDLDYEDSTIIRREITPSGKSRAFINDTPVVLETLRNLAGPLVDIHSQHETLQLQKSHFQLQFIDSIANTASQLEEYRLAFSNFKSCKKELEEVEQASREAKKDLDYNQYLLNELNEANIIDNELTASENELAVLENAEEIKIKLQEASLILVDGEVSINDMLYEATNAIAKLASFGNQYKELHQRLESCMLELNDIHRELQASSEGVELDPEQARNFRDRIDLINSLLQKHHLKTENELIQLHEELDQKVQSTVAFDDRLLDLTKKCDALSKELNQKGLALSESRQHIFKHAETEITALLRELGMPDAVLQITREEIAPSRDGIDQIQFLFSANKGIPVADIKQVASGGEFSRLVFALKYLMAENTALPTLIFDEIDTGISGEIALKMAALMKKMAKNHQLITITHLPQMAGSGNRHFFVYKDNSLDRTTSQIKQLKEEERVSNLAEMIGGKTPSESAYQSARELLSNHV